LFVIVYHVIKTGVRIHLLFMLVYELILFNLRPFSLLIVVEVLIFWFYLDRKRIISTTAMLILLLIGLLVYTLSPLIVYYYDSVVYYHAHPDILREGHGGFSFSNISEYLVMSILAPFPTTLASMLLGNYDYTGWGYAHDVIRFINQLSVVVIFTLIVFKLIKIFILRKQF